MTYNSDIQPKEITKCSESGIEYASFDYYKGIELAKINNWQQATKEKDLIKIGYFMICCGDVMIRVVPSMYSNIERVII